MTWTEIGFGVALELGLFGAAAWYQWAQYRIRRQHLVVMWLLTVVVMVVLWVGGLAATRGWVRWVTGFAFVLGPVPAMLATAAWRLSRSQPDSR